MKASVAKNVALLVASAACFTAAWVIYSGQQAGTPVPPPPPRPSSPASGTGDAAPGAGEGTPPPEPERPRRRPKTKVAVEDFARAAEAGDAAAVRVMLENGADPMKGLDAWPPLLVAAAEGHADVVRALLDARVAVDREGPAGWTAVMMAGANDRADVTRLLLDAGANPLRPNDLDQTLFDVVAEADAAAVRSLLDEPAYRWRDTRALIRAACTIDFDTVNRLLDEGAPVDGKDDDGRTVLLVHLGFGVDTDIPKDDRRYHYDMVKLLLDRGAAINAAEPGSGRTPLMSALYLHTHGLNPAPTVELLLDRGADPNLRDRQGRTAIDIANAIYPSDPQAAIIKLLRARQSTANP